MAKFMLENRNIK